MQFSRALLISWAVAGSGSLIRRKADTAAGVDASKGGVLDLMDQMDRDLVRMNSKLGGVRSFLQLGIEDSPASSSKGKAKSTAVNVVKSATKKDSSVHKETAQKKQEKKPFDAQEVVAQMDELPLDKMGKAQLPAMLGLLTEMYGGWKEKIGVANKREKQQKKDYDATVADMEMKKKANSDADSVKTYDKIEKYWTLQRKIAHHQYHTVLKIAHAGMEKFKNVMHAVQAAMDSKKPDPATAKKIQAMEEPEVCLLQKVESLRHWAHDTITQLRDAKHA